MQVKTWLQKLTDESNLWFNAVRAEDEGDLLEAISFYLRDATQCLKQRSLVRSALSCSCAANCLAKTGNTGLASSLYSEAARGYLENAEVAIAESIRESLWSLQKAYENLVMAGDSDGSREVYERYVSLATRTSPFSGAEEAMGMLGFRKTTAESAISKAKTSSKVPQELAKEIEEFIQFRKSETLGQKKEYSRADVLAAINDKDKGSRLDEKGIAS